MILTIKEMTISGTRLSLVRTMVQSAYKHSAPIKTLAHINIMMPIQIQPNKHTDNFTSNHTGRHIRIQCRIKRNLYIQASIKASI